MCNSWQLLISCKHYFGVTPNSHIINFIDIKFKYFHTYLSFILFTMENYINF